MGLYSSAFCCAGLSPFFIPPLYSVFSFDQMSSLLPTLSVSVLFSQSCLTPFASLSSFVDGLGPSGSAIVTLFGVCTNTVVILLLWQSVAHLKCLIFISNRTKWLQGEQNVMHQ